MSEWRDKDPDVPETYAIDWQDQLIMPAMREWDFPLTAVVKAPTDTGWYYECTTAGKTKARYPDAWPRAAGETVTDGSVIWTCRHPDDASVPSVSSATWTIPTGLTLSSQIEQGRLTILTVTGGTDGEDYQVTCTMTPSTGSDMERTRTIRVRAL